MLHHVTQNSEFFCETRKWGPKYIGSIPNIIVCFLFRSLVAAGLIPYYDESPDSGDDSISDDVGPFMNMDVIFKNSDKNVDLKVETSQGVREYQDYPLKLEWTKRLRNMKLDRMIGTLIQSKIICKSKWLLKLKFKFLEDIFQKLAVLICACNNF